MASQSRRRGESPVYDRYDLGRTTSPSRGRSRPNIVAQDSYYDPRAKYYLSGDADAYGFNPARPEYTVTSTRSRHQSLSPNSRRPRQIQREPSYRSQTVDGRRDRYESRTPSRANDEDNRGRGRSDRSDRSETNTGSSRAKTTDGRARYPPSASKSAGGQRGRRSSSSSSRKDKEKKDEKEKEKELRTRDLVPTAARVAFEGAVYGAMKMRDEPGPWIGMKGTKVAASALGAVAVDAFLHKKNPDLRGTHRHGMIRHATQFALANMIAAPMAKGHKLGRE